MTPSLVIALRDRTPSEALDLGIRLVQNQRSLWLGWSLFILIISLLIWAVIPSELLWVGLLLTWWLKPLYDRFLLHGLSQVIMQNPLTLAQWFSAIQQWGGGNGLVGALLWRRFSVVRSYILPIYQLERLKKPALGKRIKLIKAQHTQHAILLSFSLLMAQGAIVLSCYALFYLFDPTESTGNHIESLFSGYVDREEEYWHHLIDYGLWVLSIIIIEPFYVAAGFTLYLSRRIQLEAWDLEQDLRAIDERLTQKAPSLIATLLLAFTLGYTALPQPTYAAETVGEYVAPAPLPASEAKGQIEAVIQAHPVYGTETVYRWEKKKASATSTANELPDHMVVKISKLLEGSLWILIAIGLILAFIYRHKLKNLLYLKRAKPLTKPLPTTLFGLDVRATSLPADIPAAARAAWANGQYREALSLLYRSVLHQLTHQYHLQIAAHHTEGDVIQVAEPALKSVQLAYLKALTLNWQQTAYGHVSPEQNALEALLAARQQAEAA